MAEYIVNFFLINVQGHDFRQFKIQRNYYIFNIFLKWLDFIKIRRVGRIKNIFDTFFLFNVSLCVSPPDNKIYYFQ